MHSSIGLVFEGKLHVSSMNDNIFQLLLSYYSLVKIKLIRNFYFYMLIISSLNYSYFDFQNSRKQYKPIR